MSLIPLRMKHLSILAGCACVHHINQNLMDTQMYIPVECLYICMICINVYGSILIVEEVQDVSSVVIYFFFIKITINNNRVTMIIIIMNVKLHGTVVLQRLMLLQFP